MSAAIKGLVSKKRIRYKQDGFDLDLTYICPNVIAMGYPGEKIEGLYRNSIDDVSKFFETKHKDRYKLYNLCSERSYDKSKFRTGSVASFPFDDHNPPSLSCIPKFCEDVYNWLSSHPENVAAIHCKAGKGRTGVMVCCYLLHSGEQKTATDALAYYANKRTHDRKGVTIPSQKRYVEYYEHLLRNKEMQYSQRPVLMSSITITGNLNLAGTYILSFTLYNPGVGYFTSGGVDWRKLSHGAGILKINLENCIPLSGDVRVDIYAKCIMRKEKICQFWFNTFFLENNIGDDFALPKTTLRFTSEEPTNIHHREREEKFGDRDPSWTVPAAADMNRPSLPAAWIRWDSVRRLTAPVGGTNTETVKPTLSLKLPKHQLDKAVKDKQDKTCPSNFKVELEFCEDFPENNKNTSSSVSWNRSNSENNGSHVHVRGSISSSDSESDESSSSSLGKNCFREPD